MKLKVTHPAVSYYNKRLRVVKFRSVNGEKRVILQTPDSKTISLPLSVALFDLGEPDLYLVEEENGVSVQEIDNSGIKGAALG